MHTHNKQIYPHTHKRWHSHRLGPSTQSHSLGLRGHGEHGKSWHKLLSLCVCVCVHVWGSVPGFIFAVRGLFSLVVHHLKPAGRLWHYRDWGFGFGFNTFCLFNHNLSDVPSSKLLCCKEANLSVWPYVRYTCVLNIAGSWVECLCQSLSCSNVWSVFCILFMAILCINADVENITLVLPCQLYITENNWQLQCYYLSWFTAYWLVKYM